MSRKPTSRRSLVVGVWLRCELTPAEGCEKIQNNEMLSDLNEFLKIQEWDSSLQMNGTKLKLVPQLKLVWDGPKVEPKEPDGPTT